MSASESIEGFINDWSKSSGAERANYALFLSGLCDVLGVPTPSPTVADESENTYVRLCRDPLIPNILPGARFGGFGYPDAGRALVQKVQRSNLLLSARTLVRDGLCNPNTHASRVRIAHQFHLCSVGDQIRKTRARARKRL